MKNKQNFTGYPSVDALHEQHATFLEKHPIIPGVSIYNTLKLLNLFYKDLYAFDCLDLQITYGELMKTSKTISVAFKELGIKANDIVAVSMPNFFQAVAIFLACNRIGAVTTFLNANSSLNEEINYLNLFESPLYVNFDKDNEYNKKIKESTHVRNVITLKPEDLTTTKFSDNQKTMGYNSFILYSDLHNISKYYKKPIKTNFGGNQDSQILFTSGSTGKSKSVVLTNQNILASGIYMKNSTRVPIKREENCLVVVPFNYPYGFDTSTIMTLICGKKAILTPDLTSTNLYKYMRKNPNYIFGSPAFYEMMMKSLSESENLSSVEFAISGGDTLTPQKSKEIKDYFKQHGADTAICNGSGFAETVSTNTTAVGMPYKPETVGKPLVGTKVKVINPSTSQECKYGEEGILCVSGKHVFSRYYKNDAETRKAKFKDENGTEWFKSDTYVTLREDGYMVIKGRESRFFILAGGEGASFYKIYCDYVQNCINSIDVVESCAVVAQPDDNSLLSPKAYIVLKNGVFDTEETINYIREKCLYPMNVEGFENAVQLKPYEIPTSFEVLEKLPRTQADKIDYKYLEQKAKEDYNKKNKKVKELKR